MELNFGHRVIAWSGGLKKYKGTFISKDGLAVAENWVLEDGLDSPRMFRHAELDPDATEFLPGDEVEVSFDKFLQNEWYPAIYLGKYKGEHFVTSTDSVTPSGWPRCRYPRKDTLNGKAAIIDGKEYELRLK